MFNGFGIRAYRRFPVHCSLYYVSQQLRGQGTIWNLSRKGWRIDGDCPVRKGMSFALCVFAPGQRKPLRIERAIVRWARGQEFGLEIADISAGEDARLYELVGSLVEETCSASSSK